VAGTTGLEPAASAMTVNEATEQQRLTVCFMSHSVAFFYSRPNVGFGLAFRDVKPHFLRVLQRWLRFAKKKIESGYNADPIDGLDEKE
jgi:hypothetical protein